MKTYVKSATKSPMNEKRWLVTCINSHETWVTASKAPKRVDCKGCDSSTAVDSLKTQYRDAVDEKNRS